MGKKFILQKKTSQPLPALITIQSRNAAAAADDSFLQFIPFCHERVQTKSDED